MNSFVHISTTRTLITLGLMMLIGMVAMNAGANNVVNSKHNLSVSGPGNMKATTEPDACIFCHTAHKNSGQTPLWSHGMSSVSNYIVYSSPTMKATVPQPDGSSRLCLSCHDGTVALGVVSSRTTPIEMVGGVTTMPSGPSNLGTDLSGDHPISFVYDSALAGLDSNIKDPATIDKRLRLDHAKKLQCATCHNPHDDQFGKFLVMDNNGSALCLSCHTDPNWSASAHNTSGATITGQAKTLLAARRAPTVAANACENCHVSHKAESKARLLAKAKEEDNCFTCHNGTVATKNLSAEFNKPSVHPVLQSSGSHNKMEDPIDAPRHVTCADCHNSHASSSRPAVAPNSPGSIAGVKGVNSVGVVVNPATREYELCFRCHGESLNRGPARVTRQFPENNKRLQFNAANQSFHPVVTIGKNPNVPSLLSPWTTSSQMYCTDCHNNDQGQRSGGAGPDGPHGSVYAPILERQLVIADGTIESPAAYALCYKCHSRTTLLFGGAGAGANVVEMHRKHVVDDKIACTTCHDSHGVQGKARLINFNTTYVSPNNGLIQYNSTGMFSGNCTLSCHGKGHQATPYSR